MGIFWATNIEKLKATKNFKGLIGALKNLKIQDKAERALIEIGKPAVESLIEALNDKDSKIRNRAADTLGKIGDEIAVEPLIESLKDGDIYVRRNVAYALGNIKDIRTVEPLIEALKDSDEVVRFAAVSALGNIGDKRAVEPLIEALKDNDTSVRRIAAYAFRYIKDIRAEEPLIEALKDKDFEVRSNAVSALGEIGDKRAVKPLIEVLKNNNARWVTDALRKITGTADLETLTKTLKVEIKCSKCGKIIGQMPTSIAEDIARGGGVVIGGGSIEMSMYQCTICPSCGSAFCDSCQRPKPDPCPKCGKSNLSPGFADLVHKYYKL